MFAIAAQAVLVERAQLEGEGSGRAFCAGTGESPGQDCGTVSVARPNSKPPVAAHAALPLPAAARYSARVATLTPPEIVEQPAPTAEERLEPPCHLILLDDDSHTYQYVIRMLGDLFGYSREKGYGIACVVDSEGRAIVMTGAKDECLLKQERIHAYGPDPLMERSQGSMSAVIEPAA